jgi:hypothetical protein
VVFLEFVAGMSFFGIFGCFSEERETNVRKMHENGGKLLSFLEKTTKKSQNNQKCSKIIKMLKTTKRFKMSKTKQKRPKVTKNDQKVDFGPKMLKNLNFGPETPKSPESAQKNLISSGDFKKCLPYAP